jgi:hypothetical protein
MNDDHSMASFTSFKEDQKRLASLAFDITDQDWEVLGLGDDRSLKVEATSNMDVTTERVTSLLLIRLIALASPSHKFPDLSTTTICQRILQSQYITSIWPETITETVMIELRKYVRTILEGYNRVPYHNVQHAYHVIISSNKLMDLILKSRPTQEVKYSKDNLRFEEDPLMHLSLLFAALIHDVDHLGIPNAQLVQESHPLAIQYNDQSVAEQRSLFLGFNELLRHDYEHLRKVMFPFTFGGDGYRRFRTAVTSLVLATDIASPDRGEIVKKKWTEAFEIQTIHESKPRVLAETGKRRMRKGGAASIIAPPKEHPTPSRGRRKSVTVPKEMKSSRTCGPSNAPSTEHEEDEWVELGATASTHFPLGTQNTLLGRSTLHSSCSHDSLIFWWFNPPEETGIVEESTDDDTFSEENGTEFFSASEGDFTSFLPDDSNHHSQGDFDSSICLLDDSGGNMVASFSDSYKYPHQSQSFQFSSSSFDADNSGEIQHLLSPSKSARHNRLCRNSGSDSWGKTHTDSTVYSDLSITSESDSCSCSMPKKFLGGLSCTPTRRVRKSSIRDQRPELDTADLTSTDASSSHTDSYSSITLFETLNASETGDESKEVTIKKQTKAKNGAIPEDSAETRDEQLCTMSLLEHILLVCDVAHTMQSWDVMNKFANRLSKEIQKAIDDKRSGGITTDPLSDWYDNQSGFLNFYIMPLAERIEKTGYIPISTDRQGPFLTTLIQANMDRWQNEGHDVVASWRRKRERRKEKKTSSKASTRQKKTKSSSSLLKNNKETKSKSTSKKKRETNRGSQLSTSSYIQSDERSGSTRPAKQSSQTRSRRHSSMSISTGKTDIQPNLSRPKRQSSMSISTWKNDAAKEPSQARPKRHSSMPSSKGKPTKKKDNTDLLDPFDRPSSIRDI